MDQSDTRVATNGVAVATSSFTDIYEAHVEEVYRLVHRRCRDHSLSEDVTQETFVAAIQSTDEQASITIGWLITVARNRLCDVLRRQVRYEDKLRLVVAGATAGDTDELVERLRVERALSDLTVDHRLVLTLHCIDGFAVPALADHLDRSVKSVEGLVTRARSELRASLDPEADVREIGCRAEFP